jgi:NAD(P)-dependent dehydrogenase (short-subunit alcohol dehydrogenase family)
MNPSEFFNKNIVVTGASSGIGQSVAYYFLNAGANVILVGKDVETMKTMCKDNNFVNATIMKVDLINDIAVYDLKTSIVERFQKPIDIMVNCAGIKLDGDIEKTFPQEFDYTLDINLRSVFMLVKLLHQFFNEGASIINMSCLYGTRPTCGLISYAMSKAGLETFTRYAAAEFAAIKVRVNAITSCPVMTNSMRALDVPEEAIEAFNKRMEKNIPLGRIAHPDDIVKVVAFLASTRSSRITGQIVKVDGGRSLTSSGYVHYRGQKNMNARFEPDGVLLGEWFNGMKKKFVSEKEVFPIRDPTKCREFVEEMLKTSNFSTRDIDAHLNVDTNYKRLNKSTNDKQERMSKERNNMG